MASFQEERYEVRRHYGGSQPGFGSDGYSNQSSHDYGSGGYDVDSATTKFSNLSTTPGYSTGGYASSGGQGGYGAASGGYPSSGGHGGYGAASGGYPSSGGHGGYAESGGHRLGYGSSGHSGYGSSGYGASGHGAGGYGRGSGYSSGGVHGGGGYGSAQMIKPSPPADALCPPEVFSDPFCALAPSSFPPGTDKKIIDCFNRIDRDRSGFICDKELQAALSGFNQSFSMRTVHLLMYMFTNSNTRRIGPNEFVPLMTALQKWKEIFQKFDRNRNGSIDASELREALCSLGFPLVPVILNLLISKFDKRGGKSSIEYDNFIECCLTVKGLTERFRTKEDCGTAVFTYEEFLITVLPFIVA